MLKTESQKFRENLEWFKNLKLISQEIYDNCLQKDILYEQSKITKKTYRAWICVNPPLGISMESLYHFSVEKLPFKNYLMCVEQNTDNGIRPHVHILADVNATARANALVSRLAKLYEVKDNFVECKISCNNVLNSHRQEYIRGEKKDSKLCNVEKDIKDREVLNIPNFYLKGII